MIMNKKLTVYESPELKILDIQAEGVLCGSATWDPFGPGEFPNDEWE